MIVNEPAFWKDYVFEFYGGHTQKCDRENWKWQWHQIKLIYSLYLDLVVKQRCYFNCLNAWLLIVPLSEIKSYVVVLLFYIKMMKGRTLHAYSLLRHSINKGMFSVYGKLDLFKLGRGGSSPPHSPLGYTPVKIKQEKTRVLLKKNKTTKRNKNLLCELKKCKWIDKSKIILILCFERFLFQKWLTMVIFLSSPD